MVVVALVEFQLQLLFDRVEERRHEQELYQQRKRARTSKQRREFIFWRQAKLSDLAREYRRLVAELDPMDDRSARLSEFYTNEVRLIHDEMRDLESTTTI